MPIWAELLGSYRRRKKRPPFVKKNPFLSDAGERSTKKHHRHPTKSSQKANAIFLGLGGRGHNKRIVIHCCALSLPERCQT